MRNLFQNAGWKKYKELAAVRGLLQWIGVSGMLMSASVLVGSWLWGRYVMLSGPLRLLVSLAAFIVASGVFAIVRYLVGNDPVIIPVKSMISDRHGDFYEPTPPSRTGKRNTSRVIASVVIVLLSGVSFYSKALDKLAIAIRPETAIFMECDMVPLPLAVPESGALHLVPLNQKRVKNQRWGFYDVGGGSREGTWPDKATVEKSEAAHNVGIWAYKCRVSNHGPTNLIYLGVDIDIWFGNKGGEINRIRYTPIISPLDSGKEVDFYLVNDCNISVAAVWQEVARGRLLNEPKQRDMPLRRTYRTPIDQIMMFWPTTVRWIGGEPCE